MFLGYPVNSCSVNHEVNYLYQMLLFQKSGWVFQEIIGISAAPPVARGLPSVRRGSLSWPDQPPWPSWLLRGSTPWELGEETRSIALWGWIRATSPGQVRESPARPVSLMLSTMPPTMNWSEPRPWSRMPLLSLMLLPSDSGKLALLLILWFPHNLPLIFRAFIFLLILCTSQSTISIKIQNSLALLFILHLQSTINI